MLCHDMGMGATDHPQPMQQLHRLAMVQVRHHDDHIDIHLPIHVDAQVVDDLMCDAVMLPLA